MNTRVKLKDQSEVLIRAMRSDDFEKSLAFFRALPAEDRACLRRDVTRPEVVRKRIAEMEEGSVKRLVAIGGAEIVADGALELTDHGWERHIGELRLIVARTHQHKGLGLLMARALYGLATAAGIEEVAVKMMPSQTGARRIFGKLGFGEEHVLRGWVKDIAGAKQDLIVMRCCIQDLLRQLEESMTEMDLRAFRS